MDRSQYILAYDVGTSGAKGVLTDMRGGILFTETAAYPLISLHPGWGEQDPECYWSSICQLAKKLISVSGISPSSVAGIAFGTMWKGIIPVDGEGRILHNSLLWLDARAEKQARQMNEKFGPGRFGSATYLAKLMWLRQEHPEIVEKAESILEVNSFLKWRATGVKAVDISNCLVASFDPKIDAYYAQIFDFMDLPREKFPPYVHSHDLVGRLTETAAAQMGLVPGIPVFGGCDDMQAATVGAGCAVPGAVYVYFGSSGWIGYTRPHKSVLDAGSPFDEDQDVAIIGVRSIGMSFSWTAKTLYKAEWEALGDAVFPLIDRETAEIPPGSDGVLAAPWFYGEWPPLASLNARGSFLNIAPSHDRRHMARAVMEGLCFNLKIRAERTAERGAFTWPSAFNAIGGGALSDVWMQMLADIMNTDVRVPYKPQHAGAAGTACCALIGLGVWSDYAEAAKNLPIEKHFRPRPEAVKIYEKNYAVYKQLFSLLKPVFDQMNTAGTEEKK